MPRFDGKKVKKLLIVLGVILIILLVILYLIDAVYEPPKEQIFYPEGHLSDDIFTEQNNEYTESETLSQQHIFENVPYIVDIPAGDGAVVGSGTVYKVSGTDFVYVSEYTDPNTIQDVIASQFPPALLSDFMPDKTNIVAHVDKQGYINGFSSEYLAEDISVTNGNAKADAVIMGYVLNLPENDIYAGNHLWVGIGTINMKNDNLVLCDAYLTAMINTVRLDEKLDEELHEDAAEAMEAVEKERALQEEKEQEQEPPVEVVPPSSDIEEPEVTDSPYSEDIYKIDIPLDEAYKTVKIDASWSESNTTAVLELFNPEKTLYFDPVEQEETNATFVIENNDIGTYELRIKGAGKCGDINTPSVTAVTGDEPREDGEQNNSNDGEGESSESGITDAADSGELEPVTQ